MSTKSKERIVAVEEHFWIPELRDRYSGPRGISAHTPARQLDDLGEIRLRDMDTAGIDVQVISHMQPGTQIFDAETAIALARRANDALYAATSAHPTRFAGFAELPTVDPKAAADELERAVTRLQFKGALINGLTAGAFLDDRRFWCIFERAQALDVPIYLHPGIPHPAVTRGLLCRSPAGRLPVSLGGMGVHGRDRNPRDKAHRQRAFSTPTHG